MDRIKLQHFPKLSDEVENTGRVYEAFLRLKGGRGVAADFLFSLTAAAAGTEVCLKFISARVDMATADDSGLSATRVSRVE